MSLIDIILVCQSMTFLGYRTQEITVKKLPLIDIILVFIVLCRFWVIVAFLSPGRFLRLLASLKVTPDTL